MAIVADASAIISLAFPDEDPAYARAVLDAIDADGASVPTIFWFEIRNALLMGERRKRVTVDQTTAFLEALAVLPIEVDFQPSEPGILGLARQHGLTVYDAAYLELARRKNFPIATVDDALIKAARAIGVLIWQTA